MPIRITIVATSKANEFAICTLAPHSSLVGTVRINCNATCTLAVGASAVNTAKATHNATDILAAIAAIVAPTVVLHKAIVAIGTGASVSVSCHINRIASDAIATQSAIVVAITRLQRAIAPLYPGAFLFSGTHIQAFGKAIPIAQSIAHAQSSISSRSSCIAAASLRANSTDSISAASTLSATEQILRNVQIGIASAEHTTASAIVQAKASDTIAIAIAIAAIAKHVINPNAFIARSISVTANANKVTLSAVLSITVGRTVSATERILAGATSGIAAKESIIATAINRTSPVVTIQSKIIILANALQNTAHAPPKAIVVANGNIGKIGQIINTGRATLVATVHMVYGGIPTCQGRISIFALPAILQTSPPPQVSIGGKNQITGFAYTLHNAIVSIVAGRGIQYVDHIASSATLSLQASRITKANVTISIGALAGLSSDAIFSRTTIVSNSTVQFRTTATIGGKSASVATATIAGYKATLNLGRSITATGRRVQNAAVSMALGGNLTLVANASTRGNTSDLINRIASLVTKGIIRYTGAASISSASQSILNSNAIHKANNTIGASRLIFGNSVVIHPVNIDLISVSVQMLLSSKVTHQGNDIAQILSTMVANSRLITYDVSVLAIHSTINANGLKQNGILDTILAKITINATSKVIHNAACFIQTIGGASSAAYIIKNIVANIQAANRMVASEMELVSVNNNHIQAAASLQVTAKSIKQAACVITATSHIANPSLILRGGHSNITLSEGMILTDRTMYRGSLSVLSSIGMLVAEGRTSVAVCNIQSKTGLLNISRNSTSAASILHLSLSSIPSAPSKMFAADSIRSVGQITSNNNKAVDIATTIYAINAMTEVGQVNFFGGASTQTKSIVSSVSSKDLIGIVSAP